MSVHASGSKFPKSTNNAACCENKINFLIVVVKTSLKDQENFLDDKFSPVLLV